MHKIKTQRDKELYGEMINIEESTQFLEMVRKNFKNEYSKAFTVFNDIKIEDLGETFQNYDGDLLRLIGQLEQKSMLVQHVDSGRFFRLPTREVAWGFKQKREEKVQDI